MLLLAVNRRRLKNFSLCRPNPQTAQNGREKTQKEQLQSHCITISKIPLGNAASLDPTLRPIRTPRNKEQAKKGQGAALDPLGAARPDPLYLGGRKQRAFL